MHRSTWFLHNLLSNLTSGRPIPRTSTCLLMFILNHQYTDIAVGWVLIYVHRHCRLIRDGSPRRPPRLSHSYWALTDIELLIYYIYTPTHPISIIYHRLTEVKIALALRRGWFYGTIMCHPAASLIWPCPVAFLWTPYTNRNDECQFL